LTFIADVQRRQNSFESFTVRISISSRPDQFRQPSMESMCLYTSIPLR